MGLWCTLGRCRPEKCWALRGQCKTEKELCNLAVALAFRQPETESGFGSWIAKA